MIDNFKTDLVLRLAAIPQDEILKAMGYQNPTSANFERLQTVIDDADFGLNDSGFDFKYSSQGFLRALCVATGIDMRVADQCINQRKRLLEEERRAFKPYIWVDTGFKRQSQPLFALAACEHQRYVDFPKGFWRLAVDQQLDRARCLVREHAHETGGDLGIWGQIEMYRYYYRKNRAILLSLDGEMVGKHEGSVPDRATGSRELGIITLATHEVQ